MPQSEDPVTIRPRLTRGRPFAPGNIGRRPGSRNRTTVVAAALLEDETDELVRKAVALAKNGDVGMLKFLLGRVLPRERLVKIRLPEIQIASHAVEALGEIMRAVSEGQISPSEGAALATLAKASVDAIDIADLVTRINALEAQLTVEVAT